MAHLWVTKYTASPPELLAPYRGFGWKVVQVHLEDDGDVPRSYADRLRRIGFTVMGCFWADEVAPEDQAGWAVAEARRLGLRAVIVNAEDPIENEDQFGREWSKRFCETFRDAAPGMGLALNTYSGCGFLDHAAWRKANARLYMQTFPGSRYGFDEDVESVLAKAQSWGWGRGRVKPCLGVYRYNGQRPSVDEMLLSMLSAGTIGLTAYYADATFDTPEYMRELVQRSLAARVAY